jgi:hypothetical protein
MGPIPPIHRPAGKTLGRRSKSRGMTKTEVKFAKEEIDQAIIRIMVPEPVSPAPSKLGKR